MSSFVLVHGAFGGGWNWRWVTPYLRTAGFEVVTPTMTGLGERAHLASPAVDLETHIRDVLQVYFYEDLHDTILVGHSYGGMIVAAVADRLPDRVRHLVYFDSDVPRDGDTSVPPERHAARIEWARTEGEGWRVSVPEEFVRSQLAAVPESTQQWVLDRMAMHPVQPWLDPIHLTGSASEIPTTYIRCTVGYDPDDLDTRRQDDRIRSEPTWRYREIDAPHMALVTHPVEIAALLLEAAESS